MTKQAVLTIDDSPSPTTGALLDALAARRMSAIFFVRCSSAQEDLDVCRSILRAGHTLGSHSANHQLFGDLDLSDCLKEIEEADSVLESIYRSEGVDWQRKYFRFPYGDDGSGACREGEAAQVDRRAQIQNRLRSLAYAGPHGLNITYDWYRAEGMYEARHWLWTYDVMEWTMVEDEPLFGIDSIEKVYARMDECVPDAGRGLNHLGSDEIVLLHDHPPTSEYVPGILDHLLDKEITWLHPNDLHVDDDVKGKQE